MRSLVIAAVRPWDSPDSGGFLVSMTGAWVRSDFSSYDDQRQIELCLACPFADECHDCLSGTGSAGRKRGFPFSKSRRGSRA